ncbi:Cytochrome b5-related protein, partial [Pseudolycoriella hygida]
MTMIFHANSDHDRTEENNSGTRSRGYMLKSTFLPLKSSGLRGIPFPNIFDWLRVKRHDDNIGNYWRVHDKLYDLNDFLPKHPGGRDWLEFTKGIDITEAFEASHIRNFTKVEEILAKYYVNDIKFPRNSPYTFDANGFYRTLKRKADPILQ